MIASCHSLRQLFSLHYNLPKHRYRPKSHRSVSSASKVDQIFLPTRLNTIPHDRETRRFFYSEAKTSMEAAIKDGEKRLLITCKIPELNTDFDVYRVGTLLELVRDLTVSLAADGKIVKVCVQQPLGQGVFQGTPLSLNGVMRIMKQMDWGPAGDFIKFGNISASEVPDADSFILISPQNINGQSIVPFLREMSEAAAAADKPIVLINPMLTDVPSSDGVMGVRGRGDRQDFVRTFPTCYYFRLLYKSSSMYPIMGALRRAYNGTWEVYKRFEPAPREEEFRIIGTFDDGEPNPTQITACFKTSPPINSSAT